MPPIWDLPTGRRPSLWRRLTPPQLFVSSFMLMIAFGTIGLKLIPGLYTGRPLSWLDALFTATSAVCTTGLIVVDTATHFTIRGQAFIILLVQMGGLGILTFTSLVLIALGGRLSLRQEALTVGQSREVGYHKINPRRLARDVFVFTFAIEAVGAVVLYLLWAPHMGWVDAVWPAIFHSISAFCNAGFSTYSDSLVSFHREPFTLMVISILVVAGGIGFLTMEELYLRYRAKKERRSFRLSLHSRLVLTTTMILLFAPVPFFLWLEWDMGLRGLESWHKLTNAFFIGTTARTAGFNAIDHTEVSDAGTFLTILLMSVGGSPGSMAGGLKTTTVALLAILAWSRLRGHQETTVWGRSLRKETTDRAIGLFVVGFLLVTVGILALSVTEGSSVHTTFLQRMFEAVSAFNIVGLSLGITGNLTESGRVVVIALMFLGRVGPLIVASALAVQTRVAGKFRYAYEEVAVG